MKKLENKIFEANKENFESLCLEVFRFQLENIEVYRKYIAYLGVNPDEVDAIEKIPFLPIEFFKTQKILFPNKKEQKIFTSSGTSGMQTSKHYVADLQLYEKSFFGSFRHFYGNPQDYCILALLPSYLERTGSSLIYMMRSLIKQSAHRKGGFYLYDTEKLAELLTQLAANKSKVLLLGVSFALLDLAEKHKMYLPQTIVMETGGMKGKRKELIREELHDFLMQRLGVNAIHSEYGMTELLSQAYSKSSGLFASPPWMKILIRDVYDPFSYAEARKTGGVNVIDLANLYSCSFIETKDLGRIYPDGKFEILGRFDNSDIRGCNLLVS
ncbi:MAG: acyl transferase [Bacteroidia bacterium]|nr:MAG: acyl transferase [Bacteroidia bacterium]